MNAHDWLRNLPLVDTDSQCRVIEVSFSQGTRKDFFRNPSLQQFEKGDLIAVRVARSILQVTGKVPPLSFEFRMGAVVAGKLPVPRLKRALPFCCRQGLAEGDSR